MFCQGGSQSLGLAQALQSPPDTNISTRTPKRFAEVPEVEIALQGLQGTVQRYGASVEFWKNVLTNILNVK